MNDLTILHLSDLHFDVDGAQPFKLYEALIKDISEELKYSDNIVIVVTGDIINQANYGSRDLAIVFFSELKKVFDEKLKKKIKGLFFAPGNHDKKRTFSMNFLSSLDDLYDEEYYDNFRMYKEDAYKDYTDLKNQILDIFGFGARSETFGSYEIKIEEKYYRFVCLDTSWSARGEDRRKLHIGKYQIDKIQSQYKEQQDNRTINQKDEVTFVLAHHPLNWLTGEDEDVVRNLLIGQRGIDADVFICGHTHTRDVINWSNNRQSLTTLSTGIGWPDSFDSEHSNVHAYATYVIHLNLNAIDIYVRSTDDSGVFAPDYRIYTTEDNKKTKKIVLPLKPVSLKSYLTLGSVKNRTEKVCYFSNSFMDDIQHFVYAMGCFRQFSTELMHQLITESSFGENNISNERKNDMFFMFIQQICELLADEILSGYKGNTLEEDRFRFHFRYCSNKNDIKNEKIYSRLSCSYYPDYLEDYVLEEMNEDKPMREITYGQLIEASFDAERPLIYSANPEVCRKETEWLDFITAIPMLDENIFFVEDRHHTRKKRPYLTFGASISTEKFRNILYCLDYYRIDRILGMIIQRFLSKVSIDMDSFMDYLNKNLRGELK